MGIPTQQAFFDDATLQAIRSIARMEEAIARMIGAESDDIIRANAEGTLDQLRMINDSVAPIISELSKTEIILTSKLAITQGDSFPLGGAGPTGPTGGIGPKGPAGDVGTVGITGPVGPIGPIGPTGSRGTESLSILPFASRSYAVVSCSRNGDPTSVVILDFGYNPSEKTLESDGTIVLDSVNLQSVFAIPFDGFLENIYMNAANYTTAFSSNIALPYIQIFTAPPEALANMEINTFTPLAAAKVVPLTGSYTGTVGANPTVYGYMTNLNIRLAAGTRILIGGMMEAQNTSATHSYQFYYTGGIAFRSF
jgi:hypothetical protein